MTVAVAAAAKTYRVRGREAVRALTGVDLDVRQGELLVVVGPSGSGKTTLLRCIAGLEDLDAGTVEVGGRDVTGAPPGDRDVAMVFQEFALYPHMTVGDNISFGLRARRVAPSEVAARVAAAAEHLEITDVLDRRPRELSGGERQRVALARAIVREPAAFLMDEPLSNLDAELRAHMRAEIRALQRRLETSTLYVTHDQVEAMTMGDRVAVLRAGRVEQVAAPEELYDRPANAFVARFIGNPPMNLLPAGLWPREVAAATLGARPERVRVSAVGDGVLTGTVTAAETIGHEVLVHVDVSGTTIVARVARGVTPQRGNEIGLQIDDDAIHRFDESGASL